MTGRRIRPSELADLTPVHPTTVSAWRRGVRPLPAVMGRVAQILEVPVEWLADGLGPNPIRPSRPGSTRRAHAHLGDAETDQAEGAGWLWEDPREAEEAFRTYIRNVERSVRGMVGDPDGVKLKELRLIVVDMARTSARAAGRQVPAFVQVVENEVIGGTFQ
jgi:transcriptional regulator with XRE-family HTH domain